MHSKRTAYDQNYINVKTINFNLQKKRIYDRLIVESCARSNHEPQRLWCVTGCSKWSQSLPGRNYMALVPSYYHHYGHCVMCYISNYVR